MLPKIVAESVSWSGQKRTSAQRLMLGHHHSQKAREGCGLFVGWVRGFPEENFRKIPVPNREMAYSRIRAQGKANTLRTLSPHCQGPCHDLPWGVFFFFEIEIYNLPKLS